MLVMLQISGCFVRHREESLHVDMFSIDYRSPECQVVTLPLSDSTIVHSAETLDVFQPQCTRDTARSIMPLPTG